MSFCDREEEEEEKLKVQKWTEKVREKRFIPLKSQIFNKCQHPKLTVIKKMNKKVVPKNWNVAH